LKEEAVDYQPLLITAFPNASSGIAGVMV